MKKHTCSIYKDRPEVCKVYPFEYPEDGADEGVKKAFTRAVYSTLGM